MKRQFLKKNISFIKIAVVSTIATFLVANYIAYLAFYSKNSYKVYSDLKQYKNLLEQNIVDLQSENAKLQKEFFELKNLEPE